jgi:hypothetical protein
VSIFLSFDEPDNFKTQPDAWIIEVLAILALDKCSDRFVKILSAFPCPFESGIGRDPLCLIRHKPTAKLRPWHIRVVNLIWAWDQR